MRSLNKQIKNWCVNALNPYGFPDKPWKIKKSIIRQTYCKNYPYLPIENPFSTRNNFIESRYIRHKEIKKIFSPRQNITLYFAEIHVILFKIFYLLAIVFLCLLLLNVLSIDNLILFGWIIVFSISGFIYQIASKSYIYSLNRDYCEIFCILQLHYIRLDLNLSDCDSLSDSNFRNSLKRRIEKLAKLVKNIGKFQQDNSGYYETVSQDILNKTKLLKIADEDDRKNSTLRVLQNYFSQTANCFIKWNTKNLPIDKSLLEQAQRSHWRSFLNFLSNIARNLPIIEQRLNSVKQITDSIKQITDSIKAIFISIGAFRLITWIISLFS